MKEKQGLINRPEQEERKKIFLFNLNTDMKVVNPPVKTYSKGIVSTVFLLKPR